MGRIETFKLDIAPLSQSPRKIWVYLPNSYDSTNKKYDVLYMFDGHNLFYDRTATYGKSWGMKKYLDKNNIDLVVIGEDCNHTGEKRLDEYCPYPAIKTRWLQENITPEGDITAAWFVNQLKPYCEKKYRIYKERSHVGIAGSSMGGLMSAYCITKYNHIFSKAACLSSAFFFCEKALIELIRETEFKDTKIYLDVGSKELHSKSSLTKGIDLLLRVNHEFTMKKCMTYPNLVVNGTHSEESWEKLLPTFIPFLFND